MVYLVARKPLDCVQLKLFSSLFNGQESLTRPFWFFRQLRVRGLPKNHFQIKTILNYREQFKPLLFQPDEVCLMLGNCPEDGLSFGIQTGCSSQVVVSEQFSVEVPP